MPSAAFQIDPGTGVYGATGVAQDVSLAGATVNCRLGSTDGVRSVTWRIFGTHAASATAPTITSSGSPTGQIASFTVPAGEGQAYGIECVVNQGLDANGKADASLISRSAVYVLINGYVRPFFVNESFEDSSTHGYVERLNTALFTAGTFVRAGTIAETAVPDDATETTWVELASWPLTSIVPDGMCRPLSVVLHVAETEAGNDPRDNVYMHAEYTRYDSGVDRLVNDDDSPATVDDGPNVSVTWELELKSAGFSDPANDLLEVRLRESGRILYIEARCHASQDRSIRGELYLETI